MAAKSSHTLISAVYLYFPNHFNACNMIEPEERLRVASGNLLLVARTFGTLLIWTECRPCISVNWCSFSNSEGQD